MSAPDHSRQQQEVVQNKMANMDAGKGNSVAPPTFQLKADPQVAQRQEEGNGVSETVTEEVGEHLSLREGFRRQVYLDSLGKPTAGTGHLLTREERARYPVGATVPDAVLERWRQQDSQHAYAGAVQMAIQIGYEDQELVNALTAVNFQLGTAWNTIHRGTWRLLAAQNWEQAAKEAADSSWFAQTPVRVIDFQRVLLSIAGKPNDYDSLREFNADNIRKRGVVWPSQRNVDAFQVEAHEAAGGGETATNTGGGQTTTPTSETTTAEPTQEQAPAPTSQLSGSVGLDKDGSSYVGTSADIKLVQQQLIYAGLLPAEYQSRSGEMKSNVDGFLGSNTIAAIKTFQKTVMGWSKQDGRVDAGGKTWAKLASYSGQVEAPAKEEETASGGGTSPEAGSTPEEQVSAPKEEATASNEAANSDALEGPTTGDVSGPTTAGGEMTTFAEIPTSFSDKFKIGRAVGNGGSNAAGDQSKIKSLLNQAGYRTDLLSPTGNATTDAKKRLVQLKNCIYHFQLTNSGLSTDARVDPNGGTWKRMVEVAYQNSGGGTMSQAQLTAQNNTRKGSASSVPSDIKANITNGHLLGIDNSGYLLPSEMHGGARRLKTALDTIKGEIGNFSISCGYRSPEHNVKIGSNASMSQHVQGIAADIQKTSNYSPSALKRKLKAMMDAGQIPAGGLGLYSWGVHYDIRGAYTAW